MEPGERPFHGPSPPPAALLLSAASLAAAAGLSAGRLWRLPVGPLPLVLTASTGFLLAAVAAGAWRTARGRLVGLALIGCWAGDLVGQRHFVAGALCFLVAHLAFSGAFLSAGLRRLATLGWGSAAMVSAAVVLRVFLPAVPAAEVPLVVAYVVVISVMVVAVGASRAAPAPAVAAAVLFYVSDIFVARWRYGFGGSLNALFCYPLYYLACNLFALAIPSLRRGVDSVGQAPAGADAPPRRAPQPPGDHP